MENSYKNWLAEFYTQFSSRIDNIMVILVPSVVEIEGNVAVLEPLLLAIVFQAYKTPAENSARYKLLCEKLGRFEC